MLSVEVREYSGTTVSSQSGEAVNRLLGIASSEPDVFPLLSGVDLHDDTVFNERQCGRLVREFGVLAARTDDAELAAAVGRLVELANLVIVDGPGQPAHRTLVFNGD